MLKREDVVKAYNDFQRGDSVYINQNVAGDVSSDLSFKDFVALLNSKSSNAHFEIHLFIINNKASHVYYTLTSCANFQETESKAVKHFGDFKIISIGWYTCDGEIAVKLLLE